MCRTCAEIVLDGYSDNVNTSQLQRLINHIDNKVLPKGHYWTDTHDEFFDDFKTKCHACGSYHERMNHVYSMRDDDVKTT